MGNDMFASWGIRPTRDCEHSSPVLRVCVVFRRAATAQVGLRVLTKSLEEIIASDGLSGGQYRVATVGRTALLLSDYGVLRSLALRIHGDVFSDQSSSTDDDQEEGGCDQEEGSRVIDEVVHVEPPARISSGEAAEIEEQQLAGRIERLSFDCAGAEDSSLLDSNPVLLLTCNRRPECLVIELTQGKSLHQCRMNLEAAGLLWRLPSGALVFVHPEQYAKVTSTIAALELKAFNIVIASDLEYLLEEALANVGQRAWMKAREHIDIAGESVRTVSHRAIPLSDSNKLGQSEFGLEDKLEFSRTFLCSAPQRRRPESVSQSTTEARSRAGLNPRRVCAPTEDLF